MAESTLCKESCQCYYTEEINKSVESAVKNYTPKDNTKVYIINNIILAKKSIRLPWIR